MYHVELLKEGKYAALDPCEIRFIANQTAEIWLNIDDATLPTNFWEAF